MSDEQTTASKVGPLGRVIDTDDESVHKFPDTPACFRTFMAGCRCPDCRAAHKEASSRKSPKKAPAKKATTKAGKAREKATEVDASLAGAISAGAHPVAGTTSAPKATAWEPLIGNGFAFLMWALVRWLVDGDETTAENLVPTDDEIDAIIAPVCRAIAATKLNRKYGRGVIENADLVEAGEALVAIGIRLYDPVSAKIKGDTPPTVLRRKDEVPNVQVPPQPGFHGNGVGEFIPGAQHFG